MAPTTHDPLGEVRLGLIAGLTGLAVMAAEMALARLAAPHLGASLPVWAVIVAVVLAALALGAAAGARLSRRPWRPTLAALLGLGGLGLIVLPWPGGSLLGWATAAPGRAAGLALAAGLAALPFLLAGAVAPVLVEAGVRSGGPGAVGRAAGLASAASTVGSLLGTLLPPFVTLPLLGTARTFLLAGLALWLAVLLIPRPAGPSAPGGAAALVLLLVGGLLHPLEPGDDRTGVIARAESAYHRVTVRQTPEGRRVLELDAGTAEQSVHPGPGAAVDYGPWPVLAAAPHLAPGGPGGHRAFVVGLGGGTVARLIVDRFPDAKVRGAEIDPVVVRLARRHLGLAHPRIHAIVADGRVALRREPARSLDAVIVDAYRDVYLPFHLATRELFAFAASRLRPGGVLVLNVVTLGRHPDLLAALATTVGTAFPHRYVAPVDATANLVLVGAARPLDLAALRALPALARLRSWDGPDGVVLTDDRAPIEALVHRDLWRLREAHR